jgi:hypothetical protein
MQFEGAKPKRAHNRLESATSDKMVNYGFDHLHKLHMPNTMFLAL